MSKKKRIISKVSIDSPMAPPYHKVSTQATTSSQAPSGKSYSPYRTGVYVFKATTLKTRMKTAARHDKSTNFLNLLRMALKMLVSSLTSVNMSNIWIVYH